MKRILVTGIALCMFASGSLVAQVSKIAVKGGQKFSYEMNSTLMMTQSVQGQEINIDSKSDGKIEMMAKKVAKDRIQWSYGIPSMRVKVESAMLPGGGTDTTITTKPADFTTDLSGKILEALKLDESMQMMTGGFNGNGVEQMFSPALGRKLKAGDSWEVSEVDTVDNPALGGASMYISRTTVYRYEGTVDTLKTKADRIRAEVTSMTIQGSGEIMGANMTIDGDGVTSGTSYYSTKDGVLLASSADMEMSIRMAMSGPTEMVIPMTYKSVMNMTRK